VNTIHGLVIRAGVALPGLPPAQGEHADIELELVDHVAAPSAGRPRYRAGTPDDPGSRVEIADADDGHTFFRYGDGTAFDVAHRSRPAVVRAAIAPGQTLEDLAAYLYGPVLGFILRSWGRLALHASCVRLGESAVLLAGDSGAGKSTTAAALAARGVAAMSDDLTALTADDDGRFIAWPAFDHLRLWSDAERIVLGASGRLERITPTWDKRRYPLGDGDFAAGPFPVGAIIVLEPRTDQRRTVVRTIAPPQAVITLATLTYANYLLDTTMRATELAQLGALVREVPVIAMEAPREPDDIGDLCDAIVRIAAQHAPAVR
jgi:hypothetical protein